MSDQRYKRCRQFLNVGRILAPGNIVNVQRKTKRKPARLTIEVPDVVAKGVMEHLMSRGFDRPLITGLELSWMQIDEENGGES